MAFVDIFSRSRTTNKEEKVEIKPKVVVDLRERNSLVASELVSLGCEVEFRHLEVGDYITKEVIIERKTVSDFISSMLNKRLLRQLTQMQQTESKLLIIEGIEDEELYHEDPDSGVNENAIRGLILSIVLSYKIPIITTKDYRDTAKFIKILAKKQPKEISLNLKRKSSDVNEQVQFIIESFPGIGPKTAKKLLNEFKTIKNIINADEEEIKKLIGKKSEIFRLVNKDYQQEKN